MTEPVNAWLPADAAALSVGADAVAAALVTEAARRGVELRLKRTGSRGMMWLEPLLEVEVDGVRAGYGPLSPEDVPSLFAADFPAAESHPRCVGLVEEIPFLARQQRLTFARCGIIEPLDLDAYQAHGGLAGLQRAAGMAPERIVEAVTESGLRGRGGAGFPAGIKWRTVLEQAADRKYVCCNADEGDSGTFADRMLIEGDPFTLLEGMVIAGFATGASEGLVYVRSEYPHAIATLRRAIELWRDKGLLGADVLGSGRAFDITLRRGAGAYICGEESSMLESLEGRRGEVRVRPPIPAISGLFARPTVVNNVLTLATVPLLLADAAAPTRYAALGEGRSTGTQPFQLAGNIRRGGLVERAFGITLRELIEDFGGGTLSGRPVRAVQVGGPLGAWLPASSLDVAMTYEALAGVDAMLGHGGIVVFDDSVDMARMAEFAMAFCAEESCGKCTPCRIGAVRGAETLQKIRRGEHVADNIRLVEDLCEVMTDGSLCAMGGLTPMPVLSALKHFPEDFAPADDARTHHAAQVTS